MRTGTLALALALFVGAAACRSARPTEVVNISAAASVDTGAYQRFFVDEAACRSFGDVRVDDELVHSEVVDAISEILEARGFLRVESAEADCSVFYELWVAGTDELGRERLRGRILVRDEALGRLVWRGERKAPAKDGSQGEAEVRAALRAFAGEVLQYFPLAGAPHELP